MRNKILSIFAVSVIVIFSLAGAGRAVSQKEIAAVKDLAPVKESTNQEEQLNKEDATQKVTSKDNKKDSDDLYSQIELFSFALTTIQSEYVDQKKAKELIYGSLRGMLASLDPHSQFLHPEEYT